MASARRPDVEIETILAHRALIDGSLCSYSSDHARPHRRHLGRHGAKRSRLAHAHPGLGRLRRAKTQLSGGRLGERNALPDADRALLVALDFPILGLNDLIAHLLLLLLSCALAL